MLKCQRKIIASIVLVREKDNVEAIELLDAFEQLHASASIRVIDIAQNLKCSERTLRRRSRRYFDSSPIELLQSIRLNQASYLLTKGVKSGQVWHRVGFSSHSYFSDLFKTYYGVMPSEYE